MRVLFSGDSSLSSLNISNWDTKNVTNMDGMFASCNLLSNLDFTKWCVENIPNEPANFSFNSGLNTHPNWGQPC
jgi:surface protein